MVPYRGRLALRIARLLLSVLASAWYLRSGLPDPNLPLAILLAHLVYAIIALTDMGHETPRRALANSVADGAFFLLWAWTAPLEWPAPFAAAYLLISTVLLQEVLRAIATGAFATLLSAILGGFSLGQIVLAMTGLALGAAFFKKYLDQRMSMTLRHNVIIRSQALSAREAERQRIAADFHDGPLQNFVGFQMRLEFIRRMMERDAGKAEEELRALQELCKGQVADLRSFVRSMRPPDEGMSLQASLARMADSLQRDTGINAKFTGEDLQDPPEVEVALEVLQIVREAFNNIQKHSGATRVNLSARRRGRNVEVVIEDNGAGFPFAGAFTLEELEATRLGPISIKRRVKSLNGDLAIESNPGEGAKLTLRVPF